ncbi:MAG: helix-turn-helix domain-containing protein [Planctomycetota bacterium]
MSVEGNAAPRVSDVVQQIVGCKWMVSVLSSIRAGIQRPGALERACTGISTKVLNERLAKLVRFGVLERRAFAEIPPRVEYSLTEKGHRLLPILDAIEDLEREFGD